MSRMEFMLHKKDGIHAVAFHFDRLFAIGYAGCDEKKTQVYIRELEEKTGIPAPMQIPAIFQCGNQLLTQERKVYFAGEKTCGEAKYVMITDGTQLYIGIGSDHTDRELEGQSVLKAKQVCAKPVGRFIWSYNELKDHWDEICLTSWQMVNGKKVLYQQGTLADIMRPEALLQELSGKMGDVSHAVIYSGTIPLVDGFQYGTEFICELEDDIMGRKLPLSYEAFAIKEEI